MFGSSVLFLVVTLACVGSRTHSDASNQIHGAVDKTLLPGLYRLALSKDEKWLAAGSDNLVLLWEVSTGKFIRSFAAHKKGRVYGLDFSPDGTLLATGGREDAVNATVRLWQLETSKLLAEFKGHKHSAAPVRFSNNGKSLVSCGGEGGARLWDVVTFKELHQLTYPIARGQKAAPFSSVDFAADKWLITGNGQHTRFWDVTSGKMVHEFSSEREVVSQDGKWLLHDFPVGRWEVVALGRGEKGFETVASAKELIVDDYLLGKRSSGFPPRLRLLASRGEGKWVFGTIEAKVIGDQCQGIARLIDFPTQMEIQRFIAPAVKGRETLIEDIRLSSDGKRLFTCSLEGEIRMWDVASGATLRVFQPPSDNREK